MAVRSVRVKFGVALAAVAMTVAGCGSSTSAAKPAAAGPTEVTVWHYWDGNNGDTFAAMAKAYQASHKDTTIKLVNVPGSDLLVKLQAAAQSRTLPDVVIGDLVTVPRMAALPAPSRQSWPWCPSPRPPASDSASRWLGCCSAARAAFPSPSVRCICQQADSREGVGLLCVRTSASAAAPGAGEHRSEKGRSSRTRTW